MTTQHTPTPWLADSSGLRAGVGPILFMTTGGYTGRSTAKANAAFIVRACNAHEELVTALDDLKAYAEGQGLMFSVGWGKTVHERVRAALAKARDATGG